MADFAIRIYKCGPSRPGEVFLSPPHFLIGLTMDSGLWCKYHYCCSRGSGAVVIWPPAIALRIQHCCPSSWAPVQLRPGPVWLLGSGEANVRSSMVPGLHCSCSSSLALLQLPWCQACFQDSSGAFSICHSHHRTKHNFWAAGIRQ